MKNLILVITEFVLAIIMLIIIQEEITCLKLNPDTIYAVAILYSINFGLRSHTKLYN